jgi:NADPH2:quinone reductase
MAGETVQLAAPILRANKVDVLGHAVFHAPAEVRREGYLRLTQHSRAGDITVSREVMPLADVASAWERQRGGAGTKLVLVPIAGSVALAPFAMLAAPGKATTRRIA